jgi:hypothetical protein
VVVSYRPAKGVLKPDTLSIFSHASLPNIWTAWQAITPLVEELNVLHQEWPGLHYTVHILCSKCLKRGSPNPHAFPGKRREGCLFRGAFQVAFLETFITHATESLLNTHRLPRKAFQG